MDDELVKSPGINTEGDSGIDANSLGSPDGNDEEDKSGKKKKKKKKGKGKGKENNKSRQSDICEDSQTAELDSSVISRMFEDLGAPPLFVFKDDDDDEDPEYEYAISSAESDDSLYYKFDSELESANDDCVDSELDLVENVNESDENGESSWLCLCCHDVGEYDTEDALIAHHSAHSLEYDECYVCCMPPDNLADYMGKVVRIRMC